MRLKRTIAGFAVSGALAMASVAVTGTAQAAALSTNPGTATAASHVRPAGSWFVWDYYTDEQTCYVVGLSLEASIFDRIDNFECLYWPNIIPGHPWALYVHQN